VNSITFGVCNNKKQERKSAKRINALRSCFSNIQASEGGVSRILCKLKNAVQIEQIYSKGAARKSAVPFAVILAVNLPYVKDQ